jgi:hypothetical protein
VALVVTPIVTLLLLGILVWVIVLKTSDDFTDDVWVDNPPPPAFQPAPRPGVVPIIVPGPRINPPPGRFNPPPPPVRINPPPGRFNPPRPVRVR